MLARRGIALFAAGFVSAASLLLAGSAVAKPQDPCEASYTAPMNSTQKLKSYIDCREDRQDAELAAIREALDSPSPTSAPSATPAPTASATPTPTPSGLSLTKEPNQPAGDFYAQFPKAAASGWGENFVPISVFLGKPEHAPQLKALGINTYMGAEHDGSRISVVTGQGLSVLAQQEWTPAEIGTDPRVVGWHLSDECDMGYAGCGDTETQQLAKQTEYANTARARNDGRFLQANFGNGVLRTFWSRNTMPQHVALMDSVAVDKYAYTSPHVQGLLPNSPDWPAGANPKSSAAYGWQQDQMERFAGANPKPNWVFVETGKPYLTESGATTITADQIEGAVWSSIIHGARGIAYFQHNGPGGCTYSLVDASCASTFQANRDRVKAVNAKVQGLASVINSDSYVHNYGAAGVDTMTKQADGDLVVFAGIGLKGAPGSKTFTLPTGVTGTTVEVVGENRSIDVTGGKFVDTFAAESSHHIYRVKV